MSFLSLVSLYSFTLCLALNSGAANSTLQDFKLSETAGAYTYHDSNAWSTSSSNRFIYWKTSNDVLELTELSMDLNLNGNNLKIQFQNSPVLEGISVHETIDKVYILVSTVASVHRLVFPHPRKLGSVAATSTATALNISPRSLLTSMTGLELSRASIFYNAYTENLDDPSNYSVLNSSYGSTLGLPIPITSCSWLTPQREAVFVIANSVGSLLVVKLSSPEDPGKVISYELKQTTIIGRLWSGLVPAIMRNSQEGDEAAVSLVSHALQDDYLIFALCRDLRIRMWSYKRQECLMSYSLLQQTHTTLKSHSNINVRRPVILKKWNSKDNSTLYLAAFVAGGEQRQFLLFEPIVENGHYKLRNLASINAPEADLIDFCIADNEIWSLWLNSDNVPNVLHCPIESCSSWDWRSLALHSQFAHKININSILVDPREFYIQDIFWSGNFSLQTIAKSISIMSRISESSLIGCKIELLIEEATKIVENKIRSLVGAAELSAEEYTNLELDSWEKLHSFCVQYHNVENKPLGLFVDPRTGLKGIIKKSNIEFLRKCDPFDEAIISSMFDNKFSYDLLCDDSSVESSLAILLKSINTISQSLTEDDMIAFEASLLRGESAENAVSALIENSLMLAINPNSLNGEPLKHAFDSIFAKAPQLFEAIEIANKALDLDLKDSSNADEEENFSRSVLPIFINFLSSNSGLALLSESVKQMSRLRFNFCRDLLLFQLFISQVRNKDSLEVIEKMHSNTIPLTAMYLHAYYFMTWVCDTPMMLAAVQSVNTEDSAAHLALLELNDYININRSGSSGASLFDSGPKTILNHFIQNNGGILAKKLLSYKLTHIEENVTNLEIWSAIMPEHVLSVAQLVWPISTQFKLAEFLLGFGQYQLLQQYINKLDVWCQWNVSSRQFLKALCYLILGEPNKSVPLFNKAIFGVNEESFLNGIIIGQLFENQAEDDVIKSNIVFRYYNKLLQLFSLYSHSGAVVDVINSAITMLDETNDLNYEEHMSSLYSTLFMCQLELGNTTEAYEAMILNPDISQKKVCLRQFIVHHCESGQLSGLTAFTYNDIEDEFVNIIESRARSTDLLLSNQINYYQLLYSYFVRDSNYRKAASVMYEYCRRLSQEVNGIESTKKQVTCYLITLNCLKIVNPKYSWIVKPSARRPTSPLAKRKHDSQVSRDGLEEQEFLQPIIEILDSNDIKREYELVKARLRLLQKDEKTYAIANTYLGPTETVTLLISANLYDLAFTLSSLLKLKFEPIFEGIVSKYIYLIQSGNSYEIVDVYDCFVDNDSASLGFINSADLTPVEKMWHLISAYIDKYEIPGQTSMKRCVSEKLLSNGIQIPTCLKLKYQKQNCPELLRLLISYNFIEEAVNLSIEYIRAFRGTGTDYFDIRCALLPNTPPLYIPFHIFTTLLTILNEDKRVDPHYEAMHSKLDKEVKDLRLLARNTTLNA